MANRELDDVYNRITAKDSYKNRKFEDKKSIIDDYTGERIFYGNNNNAKKVHSLDKTTDIDHVTPIAKVKNRYSDLTIEQQKKLANNEKYNYAVTNSKLNRIDKNALENHEYVKNQAKNVINDIKNGELSTAIERSKDLSKKSGRMLAAEAKSRTGMSIEATGMRIINNVEEMNPEIKSDLVLKGKFAARTAKNVGKEFVTGAKDTVMKSAIPLTVEAVRKLCEVSKGEKTLSDAAKDMGKITANVAIVGETNKVIVDGVKVALMNSKKEAFVKLANSNEVAQIIAVAAIVKDSAIKYINEEIDGKEFIEEVGERGTTMVAGLIGGEVGKEIGEIIGAIAGTAVLPGGGTAGGIIAGAVIGEVLGTIITTVACSAIVSVISTTKHLNDYKLKDSQIRIIEAEALNEMSNQRDKLRNIFEQGYRYWDVEIQEGFGMILSSACEQSYNLQGITDGLDKILSIFGKNVAFKSLDEYEMQLGSTLVLNFGKR